MGIREGIVPKSDAYLSGLQTQLTEKELPSFCDNPVINSLAADYARRCGELEIETDFSISMPDGFSVPNYEMCIVLGNLLENAVEACQKLNPRMAAGRNRKIELVVKMEGEHLAIMVRNTFDGNVAKAGEELVSMKKDGGIGLQSVKAVAAQYCQSFFTEYDKEWFSAYVLWRSGTNTFNKN